MSSLCFGVFVFFDILWQGNKKIRFSEEEKWCGIAAPRKKNNDEKKCQIQANQDVSLILSYALNFQKMVQLWGSRWFKKEPYSSKYEKNFWILRYVMTGLNCNTTPIGCFNIMLINNYYIFELIWINKRLNIKTFSVNYKWNRYLQFHYLIISSPMGNMNRTTMNK